MLLRSVFPWRRKRDSFARKPLIRRKLLIFQLAKLAGFASKRAFGSFDLQTRYSKFAFRHGRPQLFEPSSQLNPS